ncbi:MAG: hypothetical protein LBV79_04520 [Candidatus Adiutrix sp.]|nr:hypothetical protein [Candidatus Adiutrix sp.]
MALFAKRRDGTVMMEHCRAVIEQTGLWPKDFPPPVVPPELLAVWDWYWELRRAAEAGREGPGPLKFSEILAWARLKRLRLNASELRWLTVLDAAFLAKVRRDSVRVK